MEKAVYLHGRGLACALGGTLHESLECLCNGEVRPGAVEISPGCHHPYFAIAASSNDWYDRARAIVTQVMAEGATGSLVDVPMIVASSSLNVGALESGSPYLADCQTFVEQLAAWLEWRGPVAWISTACTSSMVALIEAHALISSGQCDDVVVLGLELFNRFSSAGFGAMQLLDDERPRPLAADRRGLVLGEAVAALVLSREPSRWRIRGGANVIAGLSPTGADRGTVTTMVERALDLSGVSQSDVGLIKLQAAGSPQNDLEEIIGLRSVFDPLPPLATLKTVLGHTLGAAGAAEIALTTACIERGLWPSVETIAPDPQINAACVDRWIPARYLLANILGFGGGHACLVVEDCEVAQ